MTRSRYGGRLSVLKVHTVGSAGGRHIPLLAFESPLEMALFGDEQLRAIARGECARRGLIFWWINALEWE